MNRPLYLILVLSGLLALGYAAVAPVGSAPDEGAHLQYVRYLGTEGRLPVLDLERRRAEAHADAGYEAHQPPVYYTLAVPFYHAGRLIAGETGAGQACRLLSILLGLAGTALIWLLAREIAPGRPGLWIAAAGLAAFLPMRLHVMASVSNDMAAEATGTLALLLMLRLRGGPHLTRGAARLGGALGLALLAKQSGILLLPPALVALYAAWKRDEQAEERVFLTAGAALAGVVAVLAGWWLVRNTLVYGDPLAQSAFNHYFADTPRWDDFRQRGWSFGRYLGRLVLPTTFATFWGAFGYLDRPDRFMGVIGPGYPPRSWVYPILLAGVCLAVFGWFVGRARTRGEGFRPEPWILGTHALFVFSAFLNFNSTYFQGQGRYLFPALGGVALALAHGWLAFWPKREERSAWAIAAGVFLLAVYALVWVLPGLRAA